MFLYILIAILQATEATSEPITLTETDTITTSTTTCLESDATTFSKVIVTESDNTVIRSFFRYTNTATAHWLTQTSQESISNHQETSSSSIFTAEANKAVIPTESPAILNILPSQSKGMSTKEVVDEKTCGFRRFPLGNCF